MFIIFISGLGLGLLASRIWLDLLSFMLGFAFVALAVLVWMRINRRLSLRKRRPALERPLDELIKIVESANGHLEKLIVYNIERQEADRMIFHLQMFGDILPDGSTVMHDLKTETVIRGERAGFLQVKFATYFGTTYQQGIAYPDFVSLTKPEPWLTDRLKRLRTLIGDASMHAARQASDSPPGA